MKQTDEPKGVAIPKPEEETEEVVVIPQKSREEIVMEKYPIKSIEKYGEPQINKYYKMFAQSSDVNESVQKFVDKYKLQPKEVIRHKSIGTLWIGQIPNQEFMDCKDCGKNSKFYFYSDDEKFCGNCGSKS